MNSDANATPLSGRPVVSTPNPLALGKPPLEILERLFRLVEIRDPRVIMGPRVGEDAAVLDMGDRYLVAKVDPITFVAEEIGWYAVHINANDLAVRGARPRWFLMTLLLPEGQANESLVERIFVQVGDACRSIGVTLVGGHTEVTQGLDRPILAGTILGEVEKDRLVTTAGARSGDAVLLTKGIAVEGTSILARECGPLLAARGVAPETRERARAFLHQPGISVQADAEIALSVAEVHAMHDPTEGGLAAGLLELAMAAGVGLRIRREAISVLPECRAVCHALGLDPLGVIASGALLLTCAPADAEGLVAAWRAGGISGTIIGEVTIADEGCRLTGPPQDEPLPRFARDEVARLFDELKAGHFDGLGAGLLGQGPPDRKASGGSVGVDPQGAPHAYTHQVPGGGGHDRS
jgi:hydrogenase expression/formation protein HypE